MKNFKQIAEDCLAGNLQGEFIYSTGGTISSKKLRRSGRKTHPYEFESSIPVLYDCEGYTNLHYSTMDDAKYYIVGFTSSTNMKKEQIKIDIPEGKVPVMEQTEKGVVITWKEHELTYKDIESKIILKNTRDCIIGYTPVIEDIKTLNCPHSDFYKKVEVLRKLTNIRNYFGKPDPKEVLSVGWWISSNLSVTSAMPAGFGNVVFLKKEHAEQAIKMLGDELKYLFEPW